MSSYCLSQTPTLIFDITNHPSLATAPVWNTVVYLMGFLPAFPPRATFSSLLFLLLPSYSVDTFQGALLTLLLFHIFNIYRSVALTDSCGLSSSRDWQLSDILLLHVSTLPPSSPLRDNHNTKYNNRIAHLSRSPHSNHCLSLQRESFYPTIDEGFETEQL